MFLTQKLENLRTKLLINDLVKKLNIVKNSELSIELAALATKPELKAEQDKMVKLQTFFHRKACFSEDDSQNMFVYQSTFSTLQLRKGKSIDYVTGCK